MPNNVYSGTSAQSMNTEAPNLDTSFWMDQDAGQVSNYSGDFSTSNLYSKFGLDPDDEAAKEKVLDFYLGEISADRANSAAIYKSQNAYQWNVKDLFKAGLNPYLAVSSGSGGPINSSSAQGNHQGGQMTSAANVGDTNSTKMAIAMLMLLMTAMKLAAL